MGSVPKSGGSPGEGHGSPLQYSCLENSMDRRAWLATVHGLAKSQTRLSDFTSLHLYIKTKYAGEETKVKNDSFVIYTISNSEEV